MEERKRERAGWVLGTDAESNTEVTRHTTGHFQIVGKERRQRTPPTWRLQASLLGCCAAHTGCSRLCTCLTLHSSYVSSQSCIVVMSCPLSTSRSPVEPRVNSDRWTSVLLCACRRHWVCGRRGKGGVKLRGWVRGASLGGDTVARTLSQCALSHKRLSS